MRDLDVITNLAKGESYREIARRVGLKSSAMQKEDHLEEGISYMIKEERPNQSYEAFLKLSRYKNGLAITRIHPPQVRKRFNISGKIFWLSTMQTSNTIDPTDLDKLISV